MTETPQQPPVQAPQPPPPLPERTTPGRFEGRTAIVTGAGSGIGRSTALRIAREGGRVVATDISSERLRELANAHPDLDLVTVVADVSDESDVREVVAAAGPRIDGLVNNAGVMDEFHPVHEVPDAIWERVLRINLDGPMRMMRAVLPAMIGAGSGSIVNVSSEAALRGSAAGVAYTASKHAVVGLTRHGSVMYAPHGVRVNSVAPGGTRTNIVAPMTSQFGMARLGPLMQTVLPPTADPEELAAVITFLLSDDASNVSGAIVPSDNGWSAI